MKRYAIRVAWLVGVFLLSSWIWANAEVNDVRLGLITGDSKSTAYRIGEDIRDLVAPYGIDLNVTASHGDVENVVAVYQRPGNHLGLVASDVLAFVAKADTDPRLKLIANKIKWVFPLYDQDVHLIGSAQIKTFSDLAGRRIAVGHVQSGTYLTSRLLFELSGVKPLELIAMDNGQALAALRDGRIDAMITVDGFPVDWLTLWVFIRRRAASGSHSRGTNPRILSSIADSRRHLPLAGNRCGYRIGKNGSGGLRFP